MPESEAPQSPQMQVPAPKGEPYDFPIRRKQCLEWVEFIIMTGMFSGIIFTSFICTGWILFGWWEAQYQRINSITSGLANHWQIILVILIPLFYRPIFKFLMNLKEGPWGAKTYHQEVPRKEEAESLSYGEDQKKKQ